MRQWIFNLALVMGAVLVGASCGGDDGATDATGGSSAAGGSAAAGGTDGGGAAAGGGGTGATGTGATGTGATGTGATGTGATGTGATAGSGGSGGCVPATCQGKLYQCGNCIDDELTPDGLIDGLDPDCLGPCDNNESGFHPDVPGLSGGECKTDCFFDHGNGSGDDDCFWDHKCDTLEKAPSYDPEGIDCAYDPSKAKTGGLGCTGAFNKQSDKCLNFCEPLTPNGCDCFGCCELPAGGGKFVWLGSNDENKVGTCSLANVGDPTKCRPCTPVKSCVNDCKHCELCLGKDKLPPDCVPPPPPDAGVGGSGGGGTGGGAGSGGSGGICGGQICPAGKQACGLPCQPPCPNLQYCLTGCCVTPPS